MMRVGVVRIANGFIVGCEHDHMGSMTYCKTAEEIGNAVMKEFARLKLEGDASSGDISKQLDLFGSIDPYRPLGLEPRTPQENTHE